MAMGKATDQALSYMVQVHPQRSDKPTFACLGCKPHSVLLANEMLQNSRVAIYLKRYDWYDVAVMICENKD